jgi:hypothetical protein
MFGDLKARTGRPLGGPAVFGRRSDCDHRRKLGDAAGGRIANDGANFSSGTLAKCRL